MTSSTVFALIPAQPLEPFLEFLCARVGLEEFVSAAERVIERGRSSGAARTLRSTAVHPGSDDRTPGHLDEETVSKADLQAFRGRLHPDNRAALDEIVRQGGKAGYRAMANAVRGSNPKKTGLQGLAGINAVARHRLKRKEFLRWKVTAYEHGRPSDWLYWIPEDVVALLAEIVAEDEV